MTGPVSKDALPVAGGALHRVWHDTEGRLGLIALLVLAIVAIAGPLLLPDPTFIPTDLVGAALQPPSAAHPFGTDRLGRDVLARVVSGARISLSVAAIAVALSMTLGAVVGAAAGLLGGWVDSILMRLVDAALAIPRIFVVLLLIAVWDRIPLPALIGVLGATGWFAASRLVRAEVLKMRTQDFVHAARALGGGRTRIIFRHLLPNTTGPVLVAAALAVGDVILVEAGLSFLGAGIRPPTPSWGAMIFDAKPTIFTAPWTGIFPGFALMITVIAVNLVAESLSDALAGRRAEPAPVP